MGDALLFGSARTKCAILAAAVGLSLATATGGNAREAGSSGGNGGGFYRSECRPPDALIGINLRSGIVLDAVVAICIPLNAERTEWAGQAYEPTQYWGGGGGVYQKIACKPGDVVGALRVSKGPSGAGTVVIHVAIQCWDLGSDYSYEVLPSQTGGTVSGTRWFSCGSNEYGSGIYGRSGTFVDKIGFMCEPR